MSVHLHISKIQRPNFTKFTVLPVALAWSSCDNMQFVMYNSAISYVLLLLWMASCFHIMGHIQMGHIHIEN